MRIYYLNFTEDDFTVDGSDWTSDTYDLYENGQYVNYSLTKSTLGTNLLGDFVWTGMSYSGAGPDYITDGGRIEDGRYIDHTGRIDITKYHFDITDQPGTSPINAHLEVYTAPDPDYYFPDEWVSKADVRSRGMVLHIDSFRYAKFRLVFDSNQDLSLIKFTLCVRIDIDIPNMGKPMARKTRNILYKFPEWMAIREVENVSSATPALDEPVSLGGKLLNTVVGTFLDDLDTKISDLKLQEFIDTASEDQLAFSYATIIEDDPFLPFSINGDGVELTRAVDLEEFYGALDTDDICYWDYKISKVYTRKLYTTFRINDIIVTQSRINVWNWFDEYGMMVDLYRLEGESNVNFKHRILDVYINQPGVSLDRFKLALRRELNLWSAFVEDATPYSYALGSTPVIYEIPDMELMDEFVRPDGLPQYKFSRLLESLARKYPTTWGYFQWEEAYWDQMGDDFDAYGLLPYQYDATPLDYQHTKAGVGDGPDLYVYRPDVPTGPVQFDMTVRAKGRHKTLRTEYPPIKFDVEIWGTADKFIYVNPEVEQWFTIIVALNNLYDMNIDYDTTNPYDTPARFYHSFQLAATNDANGDNPDGTSNGYSSYQVFMGSNFLVPGLDWWGSNGVAYPGIDDDGNPFSIDISQSTSVTLRIGQYNPDTKTIDHPPATIDGETATTLDDKDSFEVWWSNQPSSIIDWPNKSIALSSIGAPHVVMKSKKIVSGDHGSDPDFPKWESKHQTYHIALNDVSPNTATQDFSMATPKIIWAPNLDEPPNKDIHVKIITRDSEGTAIGISKDENKDELPIPANPDIHLNDAYNWDDGDYSGEMVIDVDTSTLTFNSADDPGVYPLINVPVWTMFEATLIDSINGIVDENGPWRNSQAPPVGNTNFNFKMLDLKREDFGIPDDTDYQVTWMAPEIINNEQVIAWFDSNTVEPFNVDTDITYSNDAIQEEFDEGEGKYYFDSMIARVKLVLTADPHWNPKIHSGWFYDHQDEFYLYAQEHTETAATPVFALDNVARLGAPIIVKTNEATPKEFRQVAFWNDDTEDIGLIETETVSGTDTDKLYLAFEDVYDVSVVDTTTGATVSSDTSTSTNELTVDITTDRTHDYDVTYKVNQSFVADNQYVDSNFLPHTKLTLAESAPFNDYVVHYEGSIYNPATPIDLPLNGLYTSVEEGFIYLDYREWGIGTLEVRISPSNLEANGKDYALVSIRAFDVNGNPKPNIVIDLSTDFGTLDDSTVTTDRDGFTTTLLTADNTATSLTGTITVTPNVDNNLATPQEVTFNITVKRTTPHTLAAMVGADQIPADMESKTAVHGVVYNGILNPVPYANVRWRRGRSVYEIFNRYYDGEVRANEKGVFRIGPFTSASPTDPGYWFLAAESWYAGATPWAGTPNTDPTPGATPYADCFPYEASPGHGNKVGDVVFWYEYSPAEYGVETTNNLPRQTVQAREEAENATPYSYYNSYPVTYDDATPTSAATPNNLNWEPPQWYAINRYKQYQLGLLGTGFYTVDFTKFEFDSHPDYEEF